MEPEGPLQATSPTGRPRQVRAVRTHDRLLVAAATVFDRVGYAAAKLQDIAAEAGVSTGALYAHYRSKADLVSAIMAEQHARWDQLFEESSQWGLTSLDRLGRLVAELARTYQSDAIAQAAFRLRDDYYAHLGGGLPQPSGVWAQRLAGVLRDGQGDGSIDQTIEAESTSRILVASFFGVQDMSYQTTGRADLAERVDEWWGLMCSRLAAPVPPGARHGSRNRRRGPSNVSS